MSVTIQALIVLCIAALMAWHVWERYQIRLQQSGGARLPPVLRTELDTALYLGDEAVAGRFHPDGKIVDIGAGFYVTEAPDGARRRVTIVQPTRPAG